MGKGGWWFDASDSSHSSLYMSNIFPRGSPIIAVFSVFLVPWYFNTTCSLMLSLKPQECCISGHPYTCVPVLKRGGRGARREGCWSYRQTRISSPSAPLVENQWTRRACEWETDFSEWSKLSLWPVSALRWGDEGPHCRPRPLERCPQLLGLVSVVVCLFVFLCGHTHTHTYTHTPNMKRLSDILQFTPYSEAGLMCQCCSGGAGPRLCFWRRDELEPGRDLWARGCKQARVQMIVLQSSVL